MERLAMSELKKWKSKKKRKPLVIHGARQVGKTWLMKEFGEDEFEDYIYINFEKNKSFGRVFDGDLEVARVIKALEIETGKKIHKDKTLIIFDEIQEVPAALTSLKYFCEDAPDYYIMAAGSLLGMTLHEGTSFPVGKVEFLNLYPLSFREFLTANGGEGLADLLVEKDTDTINAFAPKFKEYLRMYYFAGGMPEVVNCLVETGDLNEVRKIQKDIITYYESDFSKHVPEAHIARVQMVWHSVLPQLSKENKKYIYGAVRKGARAKDFEIAIQWLQDYGLIRKCYRISKPGIPAESYKEQDVFKIFLHDVGLLGAMGDIPANILNDGNKAFVEFKGALTEQYVSQELTCKGYELYYYSTPGSTGEIDFIIQKSGECIPIEVKAEENLRAKSLKAYYEKYRPDFAVRTSMSDFREEEWLVNVPLYYVGEFFR